MGWLSTQEVRFAVGNPDGLTSYSWRIWNQKEKDKDVDSIYIMCRDIFKEVKVSLHASGRWRMGYQAQAIDKNSALISLNEDRAWDVWENPPDQLPNVKIAFRLFFCKRDLILTPSLREGKDWAKVKTFIEGPPTGKLTAISLFITQGDINLAHDTENSFCLTSFEIGDNKFAKVIAHAEPEGNIPTDIEKALIKAMEICKAKSTDIPDGAIYYFLGKLDDDSRYLVMTPMSI